VKLDTITYDDVLHRKLQVMDSTAITFCMDNSLPIIVFDVTQPGNIIRALVGEEIGTLVTATVPAGEDR
jgi:uridylate kinase